MFKPDRVTRMVKEMQGYFTERVQNMQSRAVDLPKGLNELAARIARLRERLKYSNPDMHADELQAAIERGQKQSTASFKSNTSAQTCRPKRSASCRAQQNSIDAKSRRASTEIHKPR